MFQILESRANVSTPVSHGGDWYNVVAGVRREIDKVVSYYNNNTYAVHGNHLLVNILNNIGVNSHMTVDRYYFNAMYNATDLSRAFGLTSSINSGRLFKNIFFSKDCTEVLMFVDDEFDYDEAYKHWRELEPVKSIEHPFSDFGINLPNGKKHSTGTGICVTSIHIGLLCVQYKAFMDEERAKVKALPDYQIKSKMQFVAMFPLPNMLRSYMEVALFNRIRCLIGGIPFDETLTKHPFLVTNWSKRLDASLSKSIEVVRNGKLSYNAIMKNLPSIRYLSIETSLELPDVAQTRQVAWALVVARMRLIALLLSLGKDFGKNNAQTNELIRYFTRIKRNNVLMVSSESVFNACLHEGLDDINTLLDI